MLIAINGPEYAHGLKRSLTDGSHGAKQNSQNRTLPIFHELWIMAAGQFTKRWTDVWERVFSYEL